MSEPVVVLDLGDGMKFYSVDVQARTFRSFENDKVYTESDLGRTMEDILAHDKMTFS